MATVIGKLSEKEQEIVLNAMRATVAHIDESEIHTRTGVRADEFSEIIKRWPNVDIEDQHRSGFLAVHNSLNEVCHGFRISTEKWGQWFDVPMDEIVATYRKWLTLTDVRGGIR